MPHMVTIEGSLTPSVGLGRGERKTCRLTEHVQRLIDRGYVTVVESEHVEPESPEYAGRPADDPNPPMVAENTDDPEQPLEVPFEVGDSVDVTRQQAEEQAAKLAETEREANRQAEEARQKVKAKRAANKAELDVEG